jgi:iron complex outermembrane receptor protein
MKGKFFPAGALIAYAASSSPVFAQDVTEVLITASPLIGDAIDQSQSVAEVSRDDLLSSGGFSLGDALRDVPGVNSSGFSPGAARPVIRGFDATRVKVTENGIGSHDVSDISADHGVPIDPLSAIEVEVLRGPGTLRYGSQAIGGVVNAINNRIPFDIAEGSATEIFSSVSTNAIERLVGGTYDYRAGALAFHADAFARGADSFDTPQGEQENTYAFGRGFALGGAYSGDSAAAGLSYNQYYSHYGIASEPGGEVAHIDLKQSNYSGAVRFNSPFSGIDTIDGRIGYSDYTHDEIVAGEGIRATFDNTEWEGRTEALHAGFGPIETGALGIQWGNRKFEALGEGADYLLPSETTTFAGYIFERAVLTDSVALEAAARVENVNITGATDALGSFDRDFTQLSFALGANYRPSESLSFFVNVSRTERAPNVTEQFAQGPHEASATYEFGDPSLGTEHALSGEAGVHYDGGTMGHATFSVFTSSFDGFITGLLTGNSYDGDGNFFAGDSADFAELLYVQRDATFWGFEGLAHIPLVDVGTGHAGIDVQADYVRAKFDGGGNVPRIPPWRVGGGVFYETDAFTLSLSALHTLKQDKTGAFETATAGFTMVDASGTFRIYNGPLGALDLALSASNLLDVTARNHISFTKDHVLLPGRNFRLALHFVR